MADRSRSFTLPFLGRLGSQESNPPHISDLEEETIGLFDQMRGRILRYALSLGLPVADAEDILQEVFLALHQYRLRGRSRVCLHGWLFQVTRNLSLKRRLTISRTAAGPLTEDAGNQATLIADPQPSPEDRLAFRQRQDRLRSVVDALPEMDRECLYLRSEGFRYREIAEVLGISVGSVANSLVRSLARLSAANERLG